MHNSKAIWSTFALKLRILTTGSRASCEGYFRPYTCILCAEYEKIIFLFCLDEIGLVGFKERLFSTGFALSAIRQGIVGLLCGLSASNQ